MRKFELFETERTPFISGDVSTGTLTIRGRSYPANAREFYSDFRSWLEHFYASPAQELNVTIDLEYLNTSTTAVLNSMLSELIEVQGRKKVNIKWNYDADDIEMEEVGHGFQRIMGPGFHLVERSHQ